jgi:hypothetical protein
MDPNANLNRQRELAGRILSGDLTPHEMIEGAANLADYVLWMHDWLSKGGVLPDAWLAGRRGGQAPPPPPLPEPAGGGGHNPVARTNAVLYRLQSGVWVGCGTFALVGLHLFVQADREQTRRSLIQEFGRMLKASIKVRFSDECPACNHVLGGSRNLDSRGECRNRDCKLAEPTAAGLGGLMGEHPYGPDEPAADYYERLRNIWRHGKAE